MPVATETASVTHLVTKREPEGIVQPGDPGSVGDRALIDALIIVIAAWLILFFLVFTLRRFNI